MLALLRDFALSFCPASVRATHRPWSSSHVLWAAILTGALETILCSQWLLHGLLAFLATRTQQYGHVLQKQNETTQAWFVIVFAVEYLLMHPSAWILSYLALEGFIRFAGGLCVSEVVPSLFVVLAFKIASSLEHRGAWHELRSLSAVDDEMQELSDGDRLRIASPCPKARWNSSLTISIAGECYEVEQEERGAFPRAYVYILRRAPLGKPMRGYEEYEIPAAVKR